MRASFDDTIILDLQKAQKAMTTKTLACCKVRAKGKDTIR